MEAKGLWDFNATQADEMSFQKDDRLCVVNMEDPDWYKAVMGPNSGLIPSSYVKMDSHDWFHGNMSRANAELLLLKRTGHGQYVHEDGNFLIRPAETDPNGFSLSVKHEDSVQHFKILKDNNNKFFIWNASSFSINQLVEKYKIENISGDTHKVIYLKDVKQEFCEALYNFQPANSEEVELQKGDKIKIISKPDENWWEGEIGGKTGFFPKTYVKELPKNE